MRRSVLLLLLLAVVALCLVAYAYEFDDEPDTLDDGDENIDEFFDEEEFEEDEETVLQADTNQSFISGGSRQVDLSSGAGRQVYKAMLDEINRKRKQCDLLGLKELKIQSLTTEVAKGQVFTAVIFCGGNAYTVETVIRVDSQHTIEDEEDEWESAFFIRKIEDQRGNIVVPCNITVTEAELATNSTTEKTASINTDHSVSWIATDYGRRDFPIGATLSPPSDDDVIDDYTTTLQNQPVQLPKSYDVRQDAAYKNCRSLKASDQKSCGSCWVWATTTSLGLRLCKQYSVTRPSDYNIELSVQDTLSCGSSNGCQGGNIYMAAYSISTYGVRNATCAPYAAKDASQGYPCRTTKNWGCSNSTVYSTIVNSVFGMTRTAASAAERVKIMQTELYTKGPLYVAFSVYEDFYNYQSGIYTKTVKTKSLGGHAVVLVGWGTDDSGTDYWTVLNSWGPDWGENGYFRVRRGTDEASFETSDVSAASLVLPPSKCINAPACKNGAARNQQTCACECLPMFTGANCDQCVQCKNGVKNNADCTCTCPAGKIGPLCEKTFQVTIKKNVITIVAEDTLAGKDYLVVNWGMYSTDPRNYPGDIRWIYNNQPCISESCQKKRTFTITIPDDYKIEDIQTYYVYVWKDLGMNEFGEHRGWKAENYQTITANWNEEESTGTTTTSSGGGSGCYWFKCWKYCDPQNAKKWCYTKASGCFPLFYSSHCTSSLECSNTCA